MVKFFILNIRSLLFFGLFYIPLVAHADKVKKQVSIALYPEIERECLERAMYFESNRSSRSGMFAVATVVMNRANSSAFPDTICGVVGQDRQFAPGVLTRPMNEKSSRALLRLVSEAVLLGAREAKVKDAMFFHQAGLTFPYDNMFYVYDAGGNSFYEKRSPKTGVLRQPANDRPYNVRQAFFAEKEGKVLRVGETIEIKQTPKPNFFEKLEMDEITKIGIYLLNHEKPIFVRQDSGK